MGEGRLADEVYSRIVAIIEAEGLAVGDRLPSEERLAGTFRVSRSVVREALVRLAADGITEARRGSGSFVKGRPSGRLAQHVPPAQLASTLASYEVRFVLEPEAARLAAARRSIDDMAAIERALTRLRATLLSSDPAHGEDMDLHRRILDAAANPAFVAAFETLVPEIERIMKAGVDISRSRPPAVIGAMLREHEMVVDAIRTQDADGAALAMRWHLAEGRRRLMPE